MSLQIPIKTLSFAFQSKLMQMKTSRQAVHLITTNPIKSEAEWKLIQLLFQSNHFRLNNFDLQFDLDSGITASQFAEWLENGYGIFDIARYGDKAVMLGGSRIESARVIGEFDVNGFSEADYNVNTADLLPMPVEIQHDLHRMLSRLGFECSFERLGVCKKYIPKPDERVYIWNLYTKLLGVVRSVSPETNEVELYCWFNYDTKECSYTMHEKDIVNFHDWHYEPMSVVMQRRLNTELNKYGKSWYDKLHRIEPFEVKTEKGNPYWYIDDCLKVVQSIEKGTPTSHFRYIAGNYFTDKETAEKYAARFRDQLNDRLASPDRPEEPPRRRN